MANQRLILLKVTTRCNLQCSYCWYSINPQLKVDIQEEMPLSTLKKLIKKIALQQKDVVYLSGGEPVLRKDINNICQFIKRTGVTMYMTTNGTILDRLLSVSPWVDGFIVSIDSARANYHNACRGQHRSTVENLKKLASKHYVCASIVLSQKNIGQLGELADRCIEWGVKAIFCQLIWYPSYHDKFHEMCFSQKHAEVFKNSLNQLRQKKHSLRIPNESYLHLLECIVSNGGMEGEVHGCFAKTQYLSVDPCGNINTCLPHKLLNADGSKTKKYQTRKKVWDGNVCRYFSEECSCLMGHYFTEILDGI